MSNTLNTLMYFWYLEDRLFHVPDDSVLTPDTDIGIFLAQFTWTYHENHSKLWTYGLAGCVVATSCKDVGMKALLTARSLCVCGEHCGLVGISGMAKFVVNDVTVLSCGDVTSLARAAWGWWGYRVQYRAPPTRRRASDAPGYWLHAASGGRAHPDCS